MVLATHAPFSSIEPVQLSHAAANMTELKNANFNIVLGPSPSRAIISDTRSGLVHSNPPSPWTTRFDFNVSAVIQPSSTSSEHTSFSQPSKNLMSSEKQDTIKEIVIGLSSEGSIITVVCTVTVAGQRLQPSVGVTEAYLELEKHFQLNPIHFAKWWKAGVPEKSRMGSTEQPKAPTPTLPDTAVSRRGILKAEKLQQQQQSIQPPPPASPALPELNAHYVRDSLDLPTHVGRGSFDSYSSSGQESCLSEACGSLSRKTVRFAGEEGNLNHHVLQTQQQQQQQQSSNILRIDPFSLGASGSEDSSCTLSPSPTEAHKSPIDIGQPYADHSRGPTMRPATRRGGPAFVDPYETDALQPMPAQPVPRLLRSVKTLQSEAKPPRPPKLTKDKHQQRARRKTTDVAELRSISGSGYLRLHDQRQPQRGATLDSPLHKTTSRTTEREWDEVDSRGPLNDDSYANVDSLHLAYQPNGWFRREPDVPTPTSTAAVGLEQVSVQPDSLHSSNHRRPYRPPRVERIDSSRLDDIARQLTSPTLMLTTPSFSHLGSERVISPAFLEPTNETSQTPTTLAVEGNHRFPVDPMYLSEKCTVFRLTTPKPVLNPVDPNLDCTSPDLYMCVFDDLLVSGARQISLLNAFPPESDNLKSHHNGFLESGHGGRLSEQMQPTAHFLSAFQPRQSQPPPLQTPAEPAVRIVPVQIVPESPASRPANTVVAAPADSTAFPEASRPKLLPRRGSMTRGRPMIVPPQPIPRSKEGNLIVDTVTDVPDSPSAPTTYREMRKVCGLGTYQLQVPARLPGDGLGAVTDFTLANGLFGTVVGKHGNPGRFERFLESAGNAQFGR
ncbi:unnamed protein product [Schistocephalus solidus]|uniref:Protein kinase domain-containing protein n=1 Tax=Schistocephalus solidus TaxID=70667 RepID=A0A183SKB6_SCHSO|nr:unnamed protein product [Schistocephalus solidus]